MTLLGIHWTRGTSDHWEDITSVSTNYWARSYWTQSHTENNYKIYVKYKKNLPESTGEWIEADRYWRKRAVKWVPNQSEQGDESTVILAGEIRILKHRKPLPLAKEEKNPRRTRTKKGIPKFCQPTSLANSWVTYIWNKFRVAQIKAKYLYWS